MNDTVGADSRSTTTTDVMLTPLYALIVLLGTAGNSLVISVVKTKRSMRSTTNFLLANLAVADLLTLVWCMPAITLRFVPHPDGKLGDFLCKFVTMNHVPGITLIVSGLTLTILSVERYKALVRPMDMHRLLNTRNVRYAIGFIWGFAVVFVAPLFVFEKYTEELKACEIHWPVPQAALAYWVTLAVIVNAGLLAITFCYFSIIRGLFFSDTICSSKNPGASAKEEARSKKRIVLMLLTVTALFLVCFLPFAIGSASMVSTSGIFYKVSTFLVYCNCAFNPFVYAFASSNYRDAFREVLQNLKPKRKEKNRGNFKLKHNLRQRSHFAEQPSKYTVVNTQL